MKRQRAVKLQLLRNKRVSAWKMRNRPNHQHISVKVMANGRSWPADANAKLVSNQIMISKRAPVSKIVTWERERDEFRSHCTVASQWLINKLFVLFCSLSGWYIPFKWNIKMCSMSAQFKSNKKWQCVLCMRRRVLSSCTRQFAYAMLSSTVQANKSNATIYGPNECNSIMERTAAANKRILWFEISQWHRIQSEMFSM